MKEKIHIENCIADGLFFCKTGQLAQGSQSPTIDYFPPTKDSHIISRTKIPSQVCPERVHFDQSTQDPQTSFEHRECNEED